MESPQKYQLDDSAMLYMSWFEKFLSDEDQVKCNYLGRKFIEATQANNNLAKIFQNPANFRLPIDTLYEMVMNEENSQNNSLEDDFDNLTFDEIPCVDCMENEKKIQELQKIQNKQHTIIASNTKLLDEFKAYVANLPTLLDKFFNNDNNEATIDNSTLSDIMPNTQLENKDYFNEVNQKIMAEIQKVLDKNQLKNKIEHSKERNALQDKIIKLQEVLKNTNHEMDEKIMKLEKYKKICINFKKQNDHLLEVLKHNDMKTLDKVERINEDMGEILAELKAKNDIVLKGLFCKHDKIGDH